MRGAALSGRGMCVGLDAAYVFTASVALLALKLLFQAVLPMDVKTYFIERDSAAFLSLKAKARGPWHAASAMGEAGEEVQGVGYIPDQFGLCLWKDGGGVKVTEVWSSGCMCIVHADAGLGHVRVC
jgi:hypothetical protein